MAVFPSWTFDSATASAALFGVETTRLETPFAAPQPVRSALQPARTKSFFITAGPRRATCFRRHSMEGTLAAIHSNECRTSDRSVRRVVEHHVGVAAAGSPERGTPNDRNCIRTSDDHSPLGRGDGPPLGDRRARPGAS